MKRALFPGLVFDEQDNPAEVVYVGEEPCYVVDDDGFRRHIPSEHVDRQVLNSMSEQIEGHEDLLTDQAAKMLGQEDIFSAPPWQTSSRISTPSSSSFSIRASPRTPWPIWACSASRSVSMCMVKCWKSTSLV